MTDIETVSREVSKRTGVDVELVQKICKHVFSETEKIMKDDEDVRDILFNNLFKFKLKRRYRENKQNPYSTK